MTEQLSIEQWVARCMEAEQERQASASSVAEAGRHLRRMAKSFRDEGLAAPSDLTAVRLTPKPLG